MNIVYTIISLHNSGGVERVVVNKANWLVEHGHQVTIITSRGVGSFFILHPSVQVLCLQVDKPQKKRFGPFGRLYYSLKKNLQHAIRLKKLLKTIKPDVVSSIHSDDFYILPLVHCKSKIIFEYHFVSDANTGGDNLYVSKLHDYALSKYDAVVYLTNSEKERHEKICNSYCIPNPKSFISEEQSPLTSKVVIAVGNLIPLKGFERLISIWWRVVEQNPQWILRIFGEGPERNHLQRQIDELHLGESVALMGRTNDILSQYKESSIMVSTAHSESFSLVLMEAQSMGLPCVSFDCPCGPREIIINNETGYLIPLDNDMLFERTLSRLMRDGNERKRLGINARLLSNRFDIDLIMKRWEELFNLI